MISFLRRIFWRHKWEYPDNGNPYRRMCAVCGEQQEYDRYWDVWNEGNHEIHWLPKMKGEKES